MEQKGFHAFTYKYHVKAGQLTTKVEVSEPFEPQTTTQIPPMKEAVSIWDTGATGSVITRTMAEQLNLKPISMQRVRGVTGEQDKNVYLVNMRLPNSVGLCFVRVTECEDILGNASVLIGMDIISMGDFSVTSVDGQTVLSFRIPSIKEVDYVVEANRINEQLNNHSGNKSKAEIKAKRKQERKNKKKARKHR
jgi:predicted aspartyl protease